MVNNLINDKNKLLFKKKNIVTEILLTWITSLGTSRINILTIAP